MDGFHWSDFDTPSTVVDAKRGQVFEVGLYSVVTLADLAGSPSSLRTDPSP